MTKEEKSTYNKAYSQAHRAERSAYQKAWYQAHRAEIAGHMKAYRLAHLAEYKARDKARSRSRGAYIKAYAVSHRAEFAANTRAWQKANPDKVTDIAARRRALKLGAAVDKVSRAVVYERDAGRCHICGKRVPKKGWHLDHIIPLARGVAKGGVHSYLNVAVSCPKCNRAKHTKAGAQLRLTG